MTLNELLSVVIFAAFVLLLTVGSISTLVRWGRYHRDGVRPPLLLKRDSILLGGLSLPFLLISAARAFGFTGQVTGDGGPEIWWLILTGAPAVIAVAVYVYFELVVIERPPRD